MLIFFQMCGGANLHHELVVHRRPLHRVHHHLCGWHLWKLSRHLRYRRQEGDEVEYEYVYSESCSRGCAYVFM